MCRSTWGGRKRSLGTRHCCGTYKNKTMAACVLPVSRQQNMAAQKQTCTDQHHKSITLGLFQLFRPDRQQRAATRTSVKVTVLWCPQCWFSRARFSEKQARYHPDHIRPPAFLPPWYSCQYFIAGPGYGSITSTSLQLILKSASTSTWSEYRNWNYLIFFISCTSHAVTCYTPLRCFSCMSVCV